MYRTFPKPKVKNEIKSAKDCCKTDLNKWDCGCSNGCDQCYVRFKCATCGGIYSHDAADKIQQSSNNQ